MPDFIPAPDDAFAHFVTVLNGAVTDLANPLGLSKAASDAWAAAYPTWTAAWGAWTALQPQIKSLLEAKDAARTALTPVARQINAASQADPSISDATKAMYDLPVHKTTHTPVPVPSTEPMMTSVVTKHLTQLLNWVDSKTPGSKAKPDGVEVCEIRQMILPLGTAAPVDPNAMTYLASDSRTPYHTEFEAADVGKTAWYAMRWVNRRQETGPWSAVSGYLIA